MSEQPKIGVLCNSTLGIPSLQGMLSGRLIAAIGVPDKENDATNDIQKIAASFQQEVAVFKKQNFKHALNNWVKTNQLDIVFVFTFPWKIPGEILTIPRFGFINFHFGLLPEYRGADAIFWPIKNRETHGGITVHQMDANFDTGGLIHIERVPIMPTDTYGMYSAKLANVNMQLLQKILPIILMGNIPTNQQNEDAAKYYSKPTIKDIAIKWSTMNPLEIVALINACNPWNKGAYTMLNGMPLRITEATTGIYSNNNTDSGTILDVNENGIIIQCVNNETLCAKIITVEEGIYTANSFAQYCGIKKGLKFNNLQV